MNVRDMKIWRTGFVLGRLILRLKWRPTHVYIGAIYDRWTGIWHVCLMPTVVLEVQWI